MNGGRWLRVPGLPGDHIEQRRPQQSADLEARVRLRRPSAGCRPRTDDVSRISSAARMRWSVIGPSRVSSPAGGAASKRARSVPGRSRPSRGGVMSVSPSTIHRFAYPASSTSPSRSTNSGTAPVARRARRSGDGRATCARRARRAGPPGATITGSRPGSRSAGWRRAPPRRRPRWPGRHRTRSRASAQSAAR